MAELGTIGELSRNEGSKRGNRIQNEINISEMQSIS